MAQAFFGRHRRKNTLGYHSGASKWLFYEQQQQKTKDKNPVRFFL
jgi:hypothetical protein